MKICCICEQEKEYTLFYKNKYSKDGFDYKCKECQKDYSSKNKERIQEYHKKYYDDNKLSKIEYQKNYYEENKDKIKNYLKEYSKKYYEENIEEIKEYSKMYSKRYYEKNKEAIKEYSKQYRLDNIENKKNYEKEYKKKNKDKISKRHKNKMNTDSTYRLIKNIRDFIRKGFKSKGFSKRSKTEEILGCTFIEFKIYLESKFESWMTWKNKGLYNGEFNFGWDIDHIVPLCSGNTEEDIIKLNHFSNLQPLCSKINRDVKRDNF